jgi:medium-chain acyl-[acyl-carrier-protein] hydrolase
MVEPSWIVRPRPNSAATLRLFCVPYAGAGVAAFSAWADLFPSTDVAVVRLPGRESRFHEPFCASIDEAADQIARAISSFHDLPCALFGHSMGALFSFEVARRLRAAGAPPIMLGVSGWRGPSLPERLPPIAHLPLDDFVVAVQGRFGGIPRAVLNNRELVSLLAPTLRADVGLVEKYRYRGDAPLPCPIVAYGGASDPHATEGEIQTWDRETTRALRARMFPGGHFFIQTARDEVLAQLRHDLTACVAQQAMAGIES